MSWTPMKEEHAPRTEQLMLSVTLHNGGTVVVFGRWVAHDKLLTEMTRVLKSYAHGFCIAERSSVSAHMIKSIDAWMLEPKPYKEK